MYRRRDQMRSDKTAFPVNARNTIPAASVPGAPESSRSSATDHESLSFLEPPKRAASLGRIGRYEALQILGWGGFGIVFRAFDEVLQRVVALKVLAPRLAAISPVREHFLRKAWSSAQIRHENVAQIYEV